VFSAFVIRKVELLGSGRLRSAMFRKVKSCCVQEGPELLCSGRLRAVVVRKVQSCCVQEG
jgi:hypothetical protein